MDTQARWDEIVTNLRDAGTTRCRDKAASAEARSTAISALRSLADSLDRGGAIPEVD